jgi:hypothetical protein
MEGQIKIQILAVPSGNPELHVIGSVATPTSLCYVNKIHVIEGQKNYLELFF